MKRETTQKVVKAIKDADAGSKARARKQIENIITHIETSPTGSVNYVTREAFDAQMIDMSESMGNRFMAINSKFEERTQYQGWLVSPDIKKRAVAVFGHALLAYIVFAGITVGVLILLGA